MVRLRAVVLLAALAALAAPAAPAAAQQWHDVAAEAGIEFRHSGPDATQRFPEMSGSGLCWSDVDQDGYDDLLFVNHPYWNATRQAEKDPQSKLYLNLGDGTFRDITAQSGLARLGWGQGCAFGDYDGDGFPDLFVAGYEGSRLYRNGGDGTFREVTAEAGVSDAGKCGDDPCWGTSGVWFDYDGDRDLDLYATNYVAWDRVGPSGPEHYPGQANLLWRNNGDGTFTDVTEQANAGNEPSMAHAKDLMAIANDYDLDGDLDLYVAADTTPNALLRNNGDGTFTDVAPQAGVDDPGASMGVEFEDLDGDGWPDLFMTHTYPDHFSLYINRRDGTFQERSGEGELADGASYIGWGTGFYDFDHDGDRDIYAVNGHFAPGQTDTNMAALFFRQTAPMVFANDTEHTGPLLPTPRSGRGSAVADYDWDGDLDLAIHSNMEQLGELGRASGTGGSWAHVVLRQPGPNAHAIGALVRITPEGGAPQVRTVKAGSSYMSQDSLAVHAGLGPAMRFDAEVRWPGGLTESWAGLPAAGIHRLHRGGGHATDTLAPRVEVVLEGERGAAGWWRSLRSFDAVVEDRAVGPPGGLAWVRYLDPATGAWADHGGPVPLDLPDGDHRLHVQAADRAGNVGGRVPLALRIDATPPVVGPELAGVAGEAGWWRSAVQVRLHAADATSGLVGVAVRLDGGAWRPYLGPLVVSGDGPHVVAWRAVDVAGNEAVGEVAVPIDAAAPELVVARGAPLAAGAGEVVLEAAALDGISGVREVRWWLDGAPADGRASAVRTPAGWFLRVAAPGLHVARAQAWDHAGNPSWPSPDVHVVVLAAPALAPPALLAFAAAAATAFWARPASPRR